MLPSPFRPQTTIASENVKTASKAAQPKVNSSMSPQPDESVLSILGVPRPCVKKRSRDAASVLTVLTCSLQAIAAPATAPGTTTTRVRQPYPHFRVIVLDDDVNTFQHVADCLLKYIPGMTGDRAWDLTNQVHFEGAATVWSGPQEQAELYHEQLRREGLTMAPLEAV